MLYSTRGIILQTIRYSETSAISRIYTEQFGVKSYMLKGIYRAKSKIKANLLQGLNLVEITADHREYKDLQYPKELKMEYPYKSIPWDVKKMATALFLNEMMLRAIRHEEADPGLFSFLRDKLIWLDESDENPPNFHLWFCIHATKYFGFMPETNTTLHQIFNMTEGCFQKSQPDHPHFIAPPLSKFFYQLLSANLEDLSNIRFTIIERRQLTVDLIEYYSLHLHDFGQIHSHKILADIFL